MLSIIIPAHNEEKRIGRTLEEYGKFFKNLKRQGKIKDFNDFEIVVVLNACNDNTIGVVKNARKKYKEIKYLNFKKGGKGFAIIEGFKYALKGKAKLIGFVDADMATSPEAFYDLVKNIDGYDGIIASRWLREAKISRQPFIRVISSRIFNFFTRALLFLPFYDTQCGAKLFKKEALEKVVWKLGSTQWAFDIDLLYKLKWKNCRIKEIPTVWHDKKGTKLRVVGVSVRMFLSIIRLRLTYSPFKFIIKMYDKMPEWLKISHKLY